MLTILPSRPQISRQLTSNSSIDRPKRPANAYLTWLNENRRFIDAQYPDTKMTEKGKISGMLWKQLDQEKKKKYLHDSKKDMEKYKDDLSMYLANMSIEEKQQLSVEKQEKQKAKLMAKRKKENIAEGKPKLKPCSAFPFYVKSQQSRRGNEPVNVFMSEIAKEWKNLPQSDKVPYTKQADQAKLDNKKILGEWEDKMREKGNLHLIRGYKTPTKNSKSKTTAKTGPKNKELKKNSKTT